MKVPTSTNSKSSEMPEPCIEQVSYQFCAFIYTLINFVIWLLFQITAEIGLTNDAVFIDIFSHRSYLHLFEVEDEYLIEFGIPLRNSIQVLSKINL